MKQAKEKEEEYAAFLSFADPDRDFVKLIHDLFWQLKVRTYFAPEQLPKAGSPEWRKQIIREIQNSYSFVPIYTRHSINRPWILYETGLADANGLPRYPARVSSVPIADIDYLPGPGAFTYDLFDKNSLAQLIINVCLSKGGDKDKVTAKVNSIVETSTFTKQIITLSKTRWVFIAGNFPTNAALPDSGIEWLTTKEDYKTRLKDFVEVLTETLLDQGFSIAACPQVSAVGMNVINKAVSCLDSKDYVGPVDFRISGIYPIDREAREITLSASAKKKWLDHIMSFRKSYLIDQEWLIVLGGNQGTREEYLAAEASKLNIFSIPCFGGTAESICGEKSTDIGEPCRSCTKRDGLCGRDGITKIVEYIEDPEKYMKKIRL